MEIHFGGSELTVVGALLTGVIGALVAIFKLLMAAKDQQIADIKTSADNFKSVAADAVRMMQEEQARRRRAEGKPHVDPLAPVEPEHQSPVTEAEEATAHLATLRAAVTAAALELGVPPRSSPPDTGGGLISKADAVRAVLSVPAEEAPEGPPRE